MKKLLALLMVLCCTSCTALPAEERAFAVTLCVEKNGDAWRIYARIPAYKASGEYLTVQGIGRSVNAALADLDAASPMQVTLSQLRLLVISNDVGINDVLAALSDNLDICQQCLVAATDMEAEAIMAALIPETGKRLSKTLDLLIESRRERGIIPDAQLASLLRMGERQSPVLAYAALEEGKLNLRGGWAAGNILTQDETALLSLLMGDVKETHLVLPEGAAHIREASAKATYLKKENAASVMLHMNVVESELSASELERAIADAALLLLTRLSSNGCDVLGLGRQAMLGMHDMQQWQQLMWKDTYRQVRWEISVRVNGRT